MTRSVIAIDIDEVIADTTETIRKITNRQKGVDLPPEAYAIPGDYWGYYEAVWQYHGVKDVTFEAIHADLLNDHLAVTVLPGAQYALSRLTNSYDIVFVTARSDDRRADTLEWFAAKLPELKAEVHFSNFLDESKRIPKGELCKRLGAELLIDDNYEHCLSAVDSGVKAILFGDYGWQHKAGSHAAIRRCKDWQGVLEYLNVD